MNHADPVVAVITQGFARGVIGAHFLIQRLFMRLKICSLPHAKSVWVARFRGCTAEKSDE
jgi:hypothetical protein